MANKHLKREPQETFNPRGQQESDAWWYEEDSGICVEIDQARLEGRCGIQATIPWRAIRAALKRKDRK